MNPIYAFDSRLRLAYNHSPIPKSIYIAPLRKDRSIKRSMTILKAIPILIAALFLGNWFLTEVRKARAARRPWYAPYLTVPGILILIVFMIPVLLKFYR